MDAQIKFKKGDHISADQAMQLALDVAMFGAPYVAPNPLVGCVAVDSHHKFLDFGFHPKYGHEHAEINILNKLSPTEIKGATFYVTLEPCAHEGKTGSCAKALSLLPIKKVIYGIIDPNPLVQGKGAAILNAAGVAAELYDGALINDLNQLCEIFLKNFRHQEIFVAAKVASSLDGQIALKTGESKWITSDASREYVHELRSYYDCIVIGANTIKIDDPSLNIRHSKISKKNKIVILDAENEIYKSNFKFQNLHAPEDIYFAVTRSDSKNPYQQLEFKDPQSFLKLLWDLGIRSVFIEGGARTYSTFLQAGLVDRLYLFLAPSVIGSANGLSWTSQVQTKMLSKKIAFRDIRTKTLGPDIFLTARVNDNF